MKKKDRIKELYINGYNSKEISNITGFTQDSIKKCISRNFQEYKFIHRENRQIKKDSLKAINKMNRQYMDDSSLLKMNRQSFNYDKNYNLIFDEERGKRPNDLPKKIKRVVWLIEIIQLVLFMKKYEKGGRIKYERIK